MAMICLSSLAGCPGEEVAREAARLTGSEYVGPELLTAAATGAGLPVEKLHQALTTAPSFFGITLATRRRCLAHLQAVLTGRLLQGPTVFLVPYGHHLVRGISHLLKVRLYAPGEVRAQSWAQARSCSAAEAVRRVREQDRVRLLLARLLFSADDDDNDLFDLVVNSSHLDVEAAAQVVAETATQPRYRETSYSRQCLEDLALANRVKAALVGEDDEVEVTSSGGLVRLRTRVTGRRSRRRRQRLQQLAEQVDGVMGVELEQVDDLISRITRPLR
ncbi:MAG: hypothetical protein DRI34_11550 [Deltaproteobacteria bacterium]|nr:MAG: hypothetical protein DRI34_11550 [Deltaproteobacteria bacterium]